MDRKSVDEFLETIDFELLKYSDDFKRHDFTSTVALKYFTTRDFSKFNVRPSDVHKRMTLNNIAKLQTPRSKLGLDFEYQESPKVSEERKLVPKQLFEEKKEDADACTFSYRSPIGLYLSEK
jgi:hypothetical protein